MRTHLLRAAAIALVAGSAALAEAEPQLLSPAVAAEMRTDALRTGGEGMALVALIAAQAMRRVAEMAEGLKRGLSGDRR